MRKQILNLDMSRFLIAAGGQQLLFKAIQPHKISLTFWHGEMQITNLHQEKMNIIYLKGNDFISSIKKRKYYFKVMLQKNYLYKD